MMPRIVVGLISIGKRLAVKVKPGGLTGCAELPSHIGIERAIRKEKIIKRIFSIRQPLDISCFQITRI